MQSNGSRPFPQEFNPRRTVRALSHRASSSASQRSRWLFSPMTWVASSASSARLRSVPLPGATTFRTPETTALAVLPYLPISFRELASQDMGVTPRRLPNPCYSYFVAHNRIFDRLCLFRLRLPWVRCATHGWDRQPLRGWLTCRCLPTAERLPSPAVGRAAHPRFAGSMPHRGRSLLADELELPEA